MIRSYWVLRSQTGVIHATLNANLVTRTMAEAFGQLIADHTKIALTITREPRHAKNPTLVHHGLAKSARWHVITARDNAPVADLYVLEPGSAVKLAEELATLTRVPMLLLSNRGLPKSIAEHSLVRGKSGNLEHRPRSHNPTRLPRVGEVWTTLHGGRCRVIAVSGQSVGVLHLETGRRERLDLADFLASYRPPRARPNPKRKGRKSGTSALQAYNDGKRAGHADRLLGRRSEYAWAGAEDPNDYTRNYAKGYRAGWNAGKQLNPARSKAARIRRALKRGATGSRKKRRAAAAGHFRKFAHLADRRSERIARRVIGNPQDAGCRVPRARRTSNPSGRYIVRKVPGPTPTGVGVGTIHEVVDTHGDLVVMRTWNINDARSQARYLNKYGPEKSKRPPDHPARRSPNPKRRNPRFKGGVVVDRIVFTKQEVADFKRRWPASGLPSSAISIALIRDNGDVVEVWPKRAEVEGYASGALTALIQDARKRQRAEHAGMRAPRGNPLPRWVDKRSVRTITRGKTRLRIGCPQGKYSPTRRRCRVGTRVIEKVSNPRSQVLEQAHKTFRRWHEFDASGMKRVRAPRSIPKTMVALGELVSVVYRSNKYDGKQKLYEHETKRPRPVLATDPRGREVFIVGGRMKPTADGLVN